MPQLTQKLVQYLDPQPTDRIIDVGCGDGKFTANLLNRVAYVYGIEAAQNDFGSSKAMFKVVDCRRLEQDPHVMKGGWDKV